MSEHVQQHDGGALDAGRVDAEDVLVYVQQLFRLFKVGALHMANNEAVAQTVEQSEKVLRTMPERGFSRIGLLFIAETVYVNGQLLKADRDTYESTLDLGRSLARIGYNSVAVTADATRDDLRELASQFFGATTRVVHTEPRREFGGVKLRRIDPAILDSLQSDASDSREVLVQAYASAVVVMRYVYDALKDGRLVSPRNTKRLLQQIALLADESPHDVVALVGMRNLHDDDAGRAVKAAIVAAVLARTLTDHRPTVVRIALSALLFDLGRPRAARLGRQAPGSRIVAISNLGPEQRARLPESTAVMLAAVGRLHPEAWERVGIGVAGQVLDLQWRSIDDERDDIGDDVAPRIVLVARLYADALAFDVRRQRARTPQQALEIMARSAVDEAHGAVVALLGSLIGVRDLQVSTGGRAAAKPAPSPPATPTPVVATAAGNLNVEHPPTPARDEQPTVEVPEVEVPAVEARERTPVPAPDRTPVPAPQPDPSPTSEPASESSLDPTPTPQAGSRPAWLLDRAPLSRVRRSPAQHAPRADRVEAPRPDADVRVEEADLSADERDALLAEFGAGARRGAGATEKGGRSGGDGSS